MFGRRYRSKTPEDFEGNKRGRDNEIRLLAALRNPLAPLPRWIIGVRAANRTEDYEEHTDAVVKTRDAGDIRIQVKSSIAYAKRFKEAYPHLIDKIVIVVVNQRMTLNQIREKVLPLILRIRKRQLQARAASEEADAQKEIERLKDVINLLPIAQHPRWIVSFHPMPPGATGYEQWNFRIETRNIVEVNLRVVIQKKGAPRSQAPTHVEKDAVIVLAKFGDSSKNLSNRIYHALCKIGAGKKRKTS